MFFVDPKKMGLKLPHFGNLLATLLVIVGASEVFMRFIKSFVLRLYIDPDAPDLFCGILQVPPDQEEFSFKNKAALITLLHQLSLTAQENNHLNPRSAIYENKSDH